jgi:hypothetical protein
VRNAENKQMSSTEEAEGKTQVATHMLTPGETEVQRTNKLSLFIAKG